MTLSYKAALFRERNRRKAYAEVMKTLDKAAREHGLTRKAMAERIGRKPAQISYWLSGPNNWTLDTVSDLLFAAKATMDYNAAFDRDRHRSNEHNEFVPPSDMVVRVREGADYGTTAVPTATDSRVDHPQ